MFTTCSATLLTVGSPSRCFVPSFWLLALSNLTRVMEARSLTRTWKVQWRTPTGQIPHTVSTVPRLLLHRLALITLDDDGIDGEHTLSQGTLPETGPKAMVRYLVVLDVREEWDIARGGTAWDDSTNGNTLNTTIGPGLGLDRSSRWTARIRNPGTALVLVRKRYHKLVPTVSKLGEIRGAIIQHLCNMK